MKTIKTQIRQKFFAGQLPIKDINVFQQARETFIAESILEFSEDLAANGILNPPIVAIFNKNGIRNYYSLTCKLKHTEFKKKKFFTTKLKNQTVYACLIAGERRYRSMSLLWDEGCATCKEEAAKKNRVLKPGDCFKKHFQSNQIEVRLVMNPSPMVCKSIQFRENHYEPPPVHEIAKEIAEFYRICIRENPHLKIATFARNNGIRVDKARKAIWFTELPPTIQADVGQGLIKFGHAVEVHKLLRTFVKDKERSLKLVNDERVFLLSRSKILLSEYKERIQNIINSQTQPMLFNLEPLKKKDVRRTVGGEILNGLSTYHHYVKKVNRLAESNQIGPGNLFSEESPKKQTLAIIDEIRRLNPNLHISAKLAKELAKAFMTPVLRKVV